MRLEGVELSEVIRLGKRGEMDEWVQVTRYVTECRLKKLGYLSFDLVQVEPSYMDKIFVSIF